MGDLVREWRPIPYCNGYEVSSLGEVRSWHIAGSGYTFRVEPTFLKTRVDRGYRKIVLRVDGRTRTCFVHRLVLAAFIGQPPDGYEARHIDGDSLNNKLSNLSWATKLQNEADKIAHGTHKAGSRAKGFKKPRRK